MVKKVDEPKYSASIRYRDGGVDKYHGVKSVTIEGNVLKIVESCSTATYIVLDILSYFNVEREE